MRPTYAYLTTHSNIWFQDTIASCPFYECVTYPASLLGLSEAPNPYRLPEVGDADVTLVDTRWFKWLDSQGEDVVRSVFGRLERITDQIVGVEAYDTFRLGAPPSMLDRCAGLVKAQGIYRDRDLYNYDVGPYFPGANWIEKSRRSERQYTGAQLERLHLSLPCFVGVDPGMRGRFRTVQVQQGVLEARARSFVDSAAALVERFVPRRPGDTRTFFVGAASHMQRIEAAEQLKQNGVPGTYGITDVPEFMFGLKERGTLGLDEGERQELLDRLRSRDLLVPRRRRLGMLRELATHGIVFAPTGFGEVTYRHAEAWRAGVSLICQDLSHAELLFPVEHGVNAWFCRPDLSDLTSRIKELTEDGALRSRLAKAGQMLWRQWSRDPDQLLQDGLMKPISRALSG